MDPENIRSDLNEESRICKFCPTKLRQLNLSEVISFQRYAITRSKGFQLTGQHRVAVMRTWEKLSQDIPTLGIATLARLFEVEPLTKQSFEFRNVPDHELLMEPLFRQHAFWVVQAVGTVMDNLDGEDEGMEEMFLEIGGTHVSVPLFHKKYFKMVPEVWCYVWEDQLKGRFSLQAAKAWRRIFGYIVSALYEGYEKAYLASRTVTSVAAEKKEKQRQAELKERAEWEKTEAEWMSEVGVDDNSTIRRSTSVKFLDEMEESYASKASKKDRAGSCSSQNTQQSEPPGTLNAVSSDTTTTTTSALSSVCSALSSAFLTSKNVVMRWSGSDTASDVASDSKPEV